MLLMLLLMLLLLLLLLLLLPLRQTQPRLRCLVGQACLPERHLPLGHPLPATGLGKHVGLGWCHHQACCCCGSST
jgi:hypothetical protein